MTPPTSVQDLAAQWNAARRLYPMYVEMAREFAIDGKPCADLEAGVDTPGKESVELATQWIDHLDSSIQVHQLRQFLQTNTLATQEGIIRLLEHFMATADKTGIIRDKIDFLLVQYFSQTAPSGINDAEVDLSFVAQTLAPIFGQVELKPPVWLNALDRVLEAARRCKSLDELLHAGILEQGRKAKNQAGELFYLPIALVAFTRFGYLMRRAFFRLMLGDLNTILDGLSDLEDKGVTTIDCRRAQFSAQEPIIRLRMICQSWKVMFQAEYSSGSPLRMLVDLRASVEHALGRDKTAAAGGKRKPAAAAKPPVAPAGKPAPPAAKAAAAAASPNDARNPPAPAAPAPRSRSATAAKRAPEFDVSGASGRDPNAPSKKK
jgi:hypothetical protein